MKEASMKRTVFASLVIGVVCSFMAAVVSAAGTPAENRGEALFMKHCSKCHPNGGNVVNVTKSLNPKDRLANNINTVEAIIRLMRAPGPGMVKFGEEVISEKDSKDIAHYILKTIK